MTKVKNNLGERRKYVRLHTPIPISYTAPESGIIHKTSSKNISADGMRFESPDSTIREADVIELKLDIPNMSNPVHARGRIVWKKKLSLEDASPFDYGVEFTEIEEDNKNTFLKFLCDYIYDMKKEPKREAKKR